MTLKPRSYQSLAADSIELHKVNLLIQPQRSGKSFVFKLIVEQYQFKKVLIIVGYRKIVKQLANYFPNEYTHILAGEPFDNSARVHLASFQTLTARKKDLDLSQYDLIIQDEYHARTSKAAKDIVFQPGATVILATGTPLTDKNKILTAGIDKTIQPITVQEMMSNGWLAPTTFFSASNLLEDNQSNLKTSRTDYDEKVVRRIIQTSDLLNNIVGLLVDKDLPKKHNTVIYVNFIETANELYNKIRVICDNVYVVHSKLSNKLQEQALLDYESGPGVLINCRALSLGWDSPRTDRLIYGFFTSIHSLALQVLWRSSTLNPADPHKHAEVYDMVGQLNYVNPYTDFSNYSNKPSCREQCDKQFKPGTMDHYFCIAGCTQPDPVLVPCTNKLPSSLLNNPYISDFQVISGEPCGESHPVWDMSFKQTDGPAGYIYKWRKCSCGCVTRYTVQTVMDAPEQMIRMYDTSANLHTVTILYSTELNRALAVLDHTDRTQYKLTEFTSSADLFTYCTQYFDGPFQILSSHPMKLPNVFVESSLTSVLPLITWGSDHSGFVRKLIRSKLEHIVDYFAIKPGLTYYFLKAVTRSNEKSVMQFLNQPNLDRAKFLRYHKKLTKDL